MKICVMTIYSNLNYYGNQHVLSLVESWIHDLYYSLGLITVHVKLKTDKDSKSKWVVVNILISVGSISHTAKAIDTLNKRS